MLKVAVASNYGITVDEHFGRARIFRIYEVEDNGETRLLEEREIRPLAPGSPEPAHSADVTVEQLGDVDAVLAAQIGPNSQQALSERGIRSFALSGPLQKALSSYGRRHKLLDVEIPGLPKGYGGGKSVTVPLGVGAGKNLSEKLMIPKTAVSHRDHREHRVNTQITDFSESPFEWQSEIL